jgi:hypothetical protein
MQQWQMQEYSSQMRRLSEAWCKEGEQTMQLQLRRMHKSSSEGRSRVEQGAKKEHKRCSYEGCTNRAQKEGVCTKHGAKKRVVQH